MSDRFKTICVCAAFLLCRSACTARVIYVSTTGDDITNTGTPDSPYRTIPKGISAAFAGDTIYIRDGTYALAGTVSISKSGTAAARYSMMAFPSEHPVLDFSAEPVGSSNRGINLTGSYWYVKGLDVYRAGDNGMHISGSNNIIEFCTFRENADTGLQLDNGASNNSVINCDSYFNVDVNQGNADGFAPKLTVGSGNYFYGCRSWQNSDDGWDGYMRGANNVTTVLENCWTFMNGYLKNGNPSSGNGNGFKMGGSDSTNLEHNMILKKCLAFDNRVKGFDQNNNRGSMTLYNCTGYRNGTNYSITRALDSGKTLQVKNCVALGPFGVLGSFGIQVTNSWLSPFVVTSADFVSIDTTGVRGPRMSDGSLPDVPFMHLAQGSDLIDSGTDVGLAYEGKGPDLGCFEFRGTTSVTGRDSKVQDFRLAQNYPNPFNPSTIIRFEIWPARPNDVMQGRDRSGGDLGFVSLKIYDVLGREVATLVNEVKEPGTYSVQFDGAALTSGVYFYRIRARRGSGQGGDVVQTKKMLLTK